MTRLAAIIVALAAMVMVGCAGREKNREVDRDLNAAESLMESQPDSALRMLQRIDTLATLSGERRARHALLLSQAYHKNYIDLTDDSLISIAVNYYEQTNNAHYKMMSYQYLGAIYLNAGQYGSALHAVLNAHDIALDLADTVNIVRAESLLGRIYVMTYDYATGLRWDSLALAKAKQMNNPAWLKVGYENIAAEHMSMGQYDDALLYADSAIAISEVPSSSILDIKFRAYFGLKMDYKADSILTIMNEMGCAPSEMMNVALSYWEKPTQEETIKHLNQAIEEQNQFITDIFKGNLSAALNQYHDNKSRRQKEEIKWKTTLITTISIVGVLVIAILVLLFVLFRMRVKEQRSQSDKAFEVLSDDYRRAKREVESEHQAKLKMQQNIEQLSQQAADAQRSCEEMRLKVSASYMRRFVWVDKLVKLYADAGSAGDQSAKQLYKTVSIELHKLKSDGFIAEAIAVCNREHPELWNEILGLGLKIQDREMLLLMISGISPSVIALLYDKSPAAIYSKKQRLKAKLQELNTTFSQFLASEI